MSRGLSASELEDIRSSYEEELAGLTFNSKPIINMLTTIAQENMNAAAVLCKTVEDRVHTAPPHQKLPVMYLLDSISKNVGSPFTPIFGRNLYKTYMACYTAVDSNTRRSLEALFSTWKLPVAGSNSSVPVYPIEATRGIDEALLRMRAVQERNPYQHYGQPPPSQFRMASPYPAASPSPYPAPTPSPYPGYPPMPYHDPNPYRQSPPAVSRPVAPAQNTAITSLLSDIEGLLRTLKTRAHLNPHDIATNTFINSLTRLHEMLQTQVLRPLQLDEIRDQLRKVAVFCAQPPPQPVHQPIQPLDQVFPPQAAPMDLFAQLAKAGILPQSGASTPVPLQELDRQPQFAGVYIELTSSAMLQSRPELIHMLYGSMPLQCYQCGQRWRDTPADRAAKDEHLDWHFKTNKRLREHAVRAQSRALYLTETEWINFSMSDEGDVQQKHEPTQVGPDLAASTVPKPSDSTLHDSVCPICKESFITDWDDASEDWVWKNAINVNGTIFHAICHAEAVAAQAKAGAVAAKSSIKHEIKQEEPPVKQEDDEDEDEDIALPMTDPVSVKHESPPPALKPDNSPAPSSPPAISIKTEPDPDPVLATGPDSTTAPSEALPMKPFILEDALRSLSGTLNALTGTKRKSMDDETEQDGTAEDSRRIKVEPR